MYGRFKAEPERYAWQVSFYNSLAENFTETMRFSGIPRNTSVFDVLNIYHSINYIVHSKVQGSVGFTLIFYEVTD
jgi:hypothetical protein